MTKETLKQANEINSEINDKLNQISELSNYLKELHNHYRTFDNSKEINHFIDRGSFRGFSVNLKRYKQFLEKEIEILEAELSELNEKFEKL